MTSLPTLASLRSRRSPWLAAVALAACAHAPRPHAAPVLLPSLGACTPVDGASATYGVEPLLHDFGLDGETDDARVPAPLEVAGLPAYVGAQTGRAEERASEGEHLDGDARFTYRIRRTPDGTTYTAVRSVDGDCPAVTREAIAYDANGRFAWRRRTHENCEFVDARIEEDALTLDAEGRFLTLERITYLHPAHVEALESATLGPTLTLADGTMPPERARETCRFAYVPGRATTAGIECTHAPEGETSLRLRCD